MWVLCALYTLFAHHIPNLITYPCTMYVSYDRPEESVTDRDFHIGKDKATK